MQNVVDQLTIRFTRDNFLWFGVAQRVFSWIEDDYGPLDERYQLFMATCEVSSFMVG